MTTLDSVTVSIANANFSATPATARKSGSYTTTDINDLLFDVEKVENEDFECNSDYAYDIFGYINGVKKRLNCCSDRYELVTNKQIFATARQTLKNEGIQFSESYTVINDSRFYAEYVLEGADFEVSKGDAIKPILKINHSYNGLTKYAITFGYFRLICTNGLVIPVAEKSEFNLRITGKHTVSIQNSLIKLGESIKFFIANTDLICKGFNQLSDHSVPEYGARLLEVLNASKIAIIDNNKFKTIGYIENVILKEAAQLNIGVNDWLIYNGINRYINDSELNIKAPEVRYESDKAVFDYLISHQ